MAKMTVKYSRALSTLADCGVTVRGMDRDDIYFNLGKLGFEWDSSQGQWVKPAISKSEVKRLRIICEKDDLEYEIEFVTKAIEASGGRVLDCTRYLTSNNPKYVNSTQVRAYLQYARV